MIEADAAARLMSETAHDLRSPLTTIRESVRLVQEESLGRINEDQQHFLAAAIDQCDCMEQMIGEMVQLERLRSGLPRVQRRWVRVQEVRKAVDDTLRPWSIPKRIAVLWDGTDDPNLMVFADPAMLRRLIVNLATNSIRVSKEGDPVLIRLHPSDGEEAIQWSIVDQGSGIRPEDLRRIEQRQAFTSSGEGLGLSICRQLAALHFSPLTIRSRRGTGTQVTFSTAAAGPNSVAECWSRWRVGFLRRMTTPDAATASAGDVDADTQQRAGGHSDRRVRLDPPSLSVELHADAVAPRCKDQFAAGVVSIGAAMPRGAADEFDALLQNQLQMFDLVYRVDARRWVWVMDVDEQAAPNRIQAINDVAISQIASLRLRWSEPQVISVDERRTVSRLGDLLIRQTLVASSPTNAADGNQVRLGTAPIQPSTTAVTRLDNELRRLSERMSHQTQRLQHQVKGLHPTPPS